MNLLSMKSSSKNFFRLPGTPIQFQCRFIVTESLWSVDIYYMVPLSLRLNYSKYCNKTTFRSFFLAKMLNSDIPLKTHYSKWTNWIGLRRSTYKTISVKIRLPNIFSKMTQKLFKSLKLWGLGSSVLECYLIEIIECFGKFYHSKKNYCLRDRNSVGQQEPSICNMNKLASGQSSSRFGRE